MSNNRKEALKKELLNKSFKSIISYNPLKSQYMPAITTSDNIGGN